MASTQVGYVLVLPLDYVWKDIDEPECRERFLRLVQVTRNVHALAFFGSRFARTIVMGERAKEEQEDRQLEQQLAVLSRNLASLLESFRREWQQQTGAASAWLLQEKQRAAVDQAMLEQRQVV